MEATNELLVPVLLAGFAAVTFIMRGLAQLQASLKKVPVNTNYKS